MKRANQEGNSIEELMFADDLVLIAYDRVDFKLRQKMQKLLYENIERPDGSDGH